MFACASFTAIGWPSWRTLWTVIRALNVCTSSARMGCLQRKSVVINIDKLQSLFLGKMDGAQACKPTLSCQPRRTGTTCGPKCIRCMLGHVYLNSVSTRDSSHEYQLEYVRLGAVSSAKTK